jgi:hypothetical protein
MGKLASLVISKGSRETLADVVPIPVLDVDRKTGVSSPDQVAAFEAAYREETATIETALGRGMLPNPEKPVEKAKADAALASYQAGKTTIAQFTKERFEPFAAGDNDGLQAYVQKLKTKYKALEKEDLKKRPLGALAYA